MNKIFLPLVLMGIILIMGCSEPPQQIPSPICGNQLCEEGESYTYCPYDCEIECKSNFCNEKVLVYCGSSNCTEKLFPAFLEMQTKVYDCLSDYFSFQPNRVSYKIVPSENPICQQKEGCTGAEGGQTNSNGISMPLPGVHPYGFNHPTLAEHLVADKHETTHYFLFQMLGPATPLWFHEALAIQTNERLYCHPQEYPQGDAYLRERENYSGGINMQDGTTLNVDFYLRLKNGQTSLSETEKNSNHILGTLFILGLKEDYGCEKECIAKIVHQLYLTRDINAPLPAEKIKLAVNEVVGKDTQALFSLLKLE